MKKYERVYQEIREKILSGEYRAGDRIPSKRVMADRCGGSLITVENAYLMLEDEGLLQAKQRRGFFVEDAEAVIPGGRRGGGTVSHLPEPSAVQRAEVADFPYSVWFRTVRRVIAERGALLLEPAPNRGCEVLRNAIADYLLRYRGMVADPRRIVIGSGAEQLYESVARVLGSSCVFGIEVPSYGRIRATYEGMGCRVCQLPLGADGIELSDLEASPADALHITPFHSFPSGVSTSGAKRRAYLRWATERGHYLIEDDFDSEFFVPGHPIQTVYSLDQSDRVIYLNTFSRSLSPSMRIGYMILPPQLEEAYEALLGQFSCSVPVMDQYILASFIASGDFERHLNHMRRKMKKASGDGTDVPS